MKVDGKDRDWSNAPTATEGKYLPEAGRDRGLISFMNWRELCLANSLF